MTEPRPRATTPNTSSTTTPTLTAATTHLIVNAVGLPALSDTQVPQLPALMPALRELMGHMVNAGQLQCEDDSPATPYELTLARVRGLHQAPGLIPWAAFETQNYHLPCAWITPSHCQVGADHALLRDPAELALDESTSRALMTAAAPYFLEDGITLHYHRPDAWLATGELFRDLPTRSLQQVVHRRITTAFFDGSTPAAVRLRRLQNEMQMLFYSHPVYDERQARGQLGVNTFWLHGAGELNPAPAPLPDVKVVIANLADMAATGQADAAPDALAAWQTFDTQTLRPLLADVQQGLALHLTLCGDHQALSYRTAPRSWLARLLHTLGRRPALPPLHQL